VSEGERRREEGRRGRDGKKMKRQKDQGKGKRDVLVGDKTDKKERNNERAEMR
jgi:hypothetical protein